MILKKELLKGWDESLLVRFPGKPLDLASNDKAR